MSSTTQTISPARLAAEHRFAGRFTEAVAAARQAIAAQPDDVESRVHLAHAAAALHDLRTAMVACDEAMRLAPANPRAHHAAAKVLIVAGEYVMAERHLRIAIDLDDDVLLQVELGDLLRRRADEAGARACYVRALERDPESRDARIGLIELGGDDVLDAARALMADAPGDPAVLCAAAPVLIRAGAAEDVIDALRALAGDGRYPDRVRAAAGFTLGNALDRLDRCDEAWAAWAGANALAGQRIDAGQYIEETSRRMAVGPGGASAPVPSGAACPVFIVGLPRSGTTLLERMLDVHPDVHGAGELGVIRRAIGRIPRLSKAAGTYPESLATIDPSGATALADFVRGELAAVGEGAPVIIDKTPDGARDLGFAARLLPDARVIWCRRDARDACLSCFQRGFSGAIPYAYHLEDLGVAARESERIMRHWMETLPTPVRIVDYETLVAQPEAELRSILEFLDLPWHAECLEFHQNDRRARTASREQVRRPLYNSAIGRWKRYEAQLRPLLEALGEGYNDDVL